MDVHVGNMARYITLRNWEKFCKHVGLPDIKDIDEETKIDITQMPVKQFKQLLSIPGRMPGYYEAPNTFLAGGAILSWLAGIDAKDRDYFGHTLNDCQAAVDYLLLQGWQFSGHVGSYAPGDDDPVLDVRDIASWYPGEKDSHLPATWAAIPTDYAQNQEFVRALNFSKDGTTLVQQVVLLIKGTPAQVIRTFDLSISQIACDGENMYWGDYTIQDLVRKRARIMRVHHPMSTMRRVIKYSMKGYWVCNGALMDAARAVGEFANAREDAGLDPLDDAVISLD